MSALPDKLSWIGRRRGNRLGPVDRSDLAALRVIGTILLSIALAVLVYYGLQFDYAAYTEFRGELRTARGTVSAVVPTGTNEPETTLSPTRNTRRSDRPEIVAVHYVFVGPDRVERHGVSYWPNSRLQVGEAVTIQYPVGKPEVSRIRGYRSAKFDTLPVAFPILVGFGVVLLFVGLFWRTARERRSDD